MNQAHAEQKITHARLLLKYVYGLVCVVAGIDKLPQLYMVTQWTKYLSPQITPLLAQIGLEVKTFLIVVGVIEIIAGLAILTNWTRLGAYLVALWLLLICANLATFGNMYLDLIVRDAVIAAGAIALAWLTEAQE